MDEVRRRAHVRAQVRRVVALEHLERVEAAAVAVLADKSVNRLVLAELVDARREDYQLSAVRHRHARAIHRLVAEPGGRELGGVEIDDALLDSVLHVVDVLLLRELHGLGEAVAPLSDEDAVRADLPAGRSIDRQHPEYRTVRKVVVEGVVEELAHGRVVAAHRLLHTADGADHVRLVYHVRAAAADEQVLRVVRHADDLVRHDLPRRDYEVVRLVHDEAVHLHVHGILPEALGNLLHLGGGNLSELHDVGAPVVDDHLGVRDVAEHRLPLGLRHRHVRAKRGQHVNFRALRRQQTVEHLRDEASVRVEAREVRRNEQCLLHRALARLPVGERLFKQRRNFVVGESALRLSNLEYVHFRLLRSPRIIPKKVAMCGSFSHSMQR